MPPQSDAWMALQVHKTRSLERLALTTIGLWLLGVPLFPTLGLIAALFNFVPYIGALAGSVPAIIIAFGISPHLAIYVAALFLVVQALEGSLISKKRLRDVDYLM